MSTGKEVEKSNGPNLVDFDSFRDKLNELRESIQSRAFELFEEREDGSPGRR